MSIPNETGFTGVPNSERQWKSVYLLGGTATLVMLAGTVLDIIIGTMIREIVVYYLTSKRSRRMSNLGR